MVTLYLNGNPPWLKVFGDDQKPRVVLVTVLTSLILLLYDGLMVCHVRFIFKTYSFRILISYLASFQISGHVWCLCVLVRCERCGTHQAESRGLSQLSVLGK